MISPYQKKQTGMYVVEFVLVNAVFLLVLFALIEFARLMYLYNAAGNATRMGARIAVVCGTDAATAIKNKMIAKVPGLTAAKINITYSPSGCSASTCESVNVALTGFTTSLSLPAQFSLRSAPIPSFSTTLVRESMSSAGNSLCT